MAILVARADFVATPRGSAPLHKKRGANRLSPHPASFVMEEVFERSPRERSLHKHQSASRTCLARWHCRCLINYQARPAIRGAQTSTCSSSIQGTRCRMELLRLTSRNCASDALTQVKPNGKLDCDAKWLRAHRKKTGTQPALAALRTLGCCGTLFKISLHHKLLKRPPSLTLQRRGASKQRSNQRENCNFTLIRSGQNG